MFVVFLFGGIEKAWHKVFGWFLYKRIAFLLMDTWMQEAEKLLPFKE